MIYKVFVLHMIVMKFGGTSVGSASMIKEAVSIVKANTDRQPIVVVSAISKITDMLIDSAKKESEEREKVLRDIKDKHNAIIAELGLKKETASKEIEELHQMAIQLKNPTKKEMDKLVSFGERISSAIFAEAAAKQGIDAKNYNAYDIGMITDQNFGSAEVLPEAYSLIEINISKMQHIPVITGFIGKSKNGDITTLGRGGSDYTAAIIGAAVNADEVQIWTDADGIMTADPRIVENARTIDTVSFGEASELAYLGAKVLHPKTILPVMNKGIPVRVLNTYNPKGKGTKIVMNAENGSERITSITYKKNVSIITINSARMFLLHGFLHKIFKTFDEHKVSVDMISTSEVSVSVTVDNKANTDITGLIEDLRKIAEVEIESNKASVSVVGRGIKKEHGITGEIFSALSEINIEMISQGASEINIGMVLNEEDSDKAVREIHNAFFGGK